MINNCWDGLFSGFTLHGTYKFTQFDYDFLKKYLDGLDFYYLSPFITKQGIPRAHSKWLKKYNIPVTEENEVKYFSDWRLGFDYLSTISDIFKNPIALLSYYLQEFIDENNMTQEQELLLKYLEAGLL